MAGPSEDSPNFCPVSFLSDAHLRDFLASAQCVGLRTADVHGTSPRGAPLVRGLAELNEGGLYIMTHSFASVRSNLETVTYGPDANAGKAFEEEVGCDGVRGMFSAC